MADDNKAMLRRFFDEVFHKGNLAVIDELVATDFVDHNPGFSFERCDALSVLLTWRDQHCERPLTARTRTRTSDPLDTCSYRNV